MECFGRLTFYIFSCHGVKLPYGTGRWPVSDIASTGNLRLFLRAPRAGRGTIS